MSTHMRVGGYGNKAAMRPPLLGRGGGGVSEGMLPQTLRYDRGPNIFPSGPTLLSQ